MDETAVKRTALLVALLGIAALFALQFFFTPRETGVGELSAQAAGESVSLHGKVESAYRKGNALFFQFNDGTGKIKCVLFNPSEAESGLLRKNGFVAVQGKVQLYDNTLEIVAEKVEDWKG